MFKDEKIKYKLDVKTKRCITAVVCGTVILAIAAAAAGKHTEITDCLLYTSPSPRDCS